MTPSRREGFSCPIASCGREHSLGDCNQDVTLAKVVERVGAEMARCRPTAGDSATLLDERPRWRNVVDGSGVDDRPRSRIVVGGRLVATYTMAERGELPYDSGLSYQTGSPAGDGYPHLDVAMLSRLKDALKVELDCQVCYTLMLDPYTTTCGHTFCRDCVASVLGYSSLCPACRATIAVAAPVRSAPGNRQLLRLLLGICPDLVAEKAAVMAATDEELAARPDETIPLFVCTLAYPGMPTFLRVFEPRYHLMMRRALESGRRKFGMVGYNQTGLPQGELGPTHFLQYGTLLHIVQLQLLPDGRSLVETIGVSRFRVKSHGVLDDYVVAQVERIDDVPIGEEENIEAMERTAMSGGPASRLSALATRDLKTICDEFVTRMRAGLAPWLHDNVIAAHGNPPEDAALFPYWFASILPIAEDEKYQLLSVVTVRDRLKITAGWVQGAQGQRWYVARVRVVLLLCLLLWFGLPYLTARLGGKPCSRSDLYVLAWL
jgi:Lon protease-like protein